MRARVNYSYRDVETLLSVCGMGGGGRRIERDCEEYRAGLDSGGEGEAVSLHYACKVHLCIFEPPNLGTWGLFQMMAHQILTHYPLTSILGEHHSYITTAYLINPNAAPNTHATGGLTPNQHPPT